MGNLLKVFTSIFVVVALAMSGVALGADDDDDDDGGGKKRKKKKGVPDIPVCQKRIATVAIEEPEYRWWIDYQLESPEALIKTYIGKSRCFSLLSRGRGLDAAMRERDLAGSGQARRGANVGKGQMKVADFWIVPQLVNANTDAGGSKLGGALGGAIGGGAGALLGGIKKKKQTAEVTLELMDTRSSEVILMGSGFARKKDTSFGGGGGAFAGAFAAIGGSSYSKTEIGQVISLAYLNAYIDLVEQMQTMEVAADDEQQAVEMNKPGRMYAGPDPRSEVVRELEVGMLLYPLGDKEGVFWHVSDELGNEGWVPSTLFQLAH